jgi:two-component system sensor histidine kinase/response regulator
MARDTALILRVLLVEDNPGDAVLVREALADAPGPTFALKWQPTLQDGLTALEEGGFDAVLLDLSLPECRGLETLERFRDGNDTVPILVLSGLDDERTAVAALHAGAQDYLVKGHFDGPLLARALRYAIERKRASDEISTLNLDLEARVQRRTAELAAANQELEGILHALTHDLRTPLRSIHGFAELLMDEAADRLDPEARDYLDRLVGASERLETVLDALLTLSRLTRTTLRWERLDISALVTRVIADQRRAWPDHRCVSTVQRGMHAIGDPRLVRIALNQLVANAFKFTRDADPATLDIGQQDDAFFVRDNGIGFDMAFADNLFKPFQRLHPDEGFEGIGIGLATAWRIIQRHGGRMWCESKTGEGATFWFTLDQRMPGED